jgi:probable F420-dependent oxidoreductase
LALGVYIYCTYVPVAQLPDLAMLAEELGFDGISVPDHVVYVTEYSSAYPYTDDSVAPWGAEMEWPDPFVSIAGMAARTERLRFLTGIFVLSLRHPLTVAKSLATLAAATGDRVECGVGVGWLKEEFEALDLDFHTRGRRTDEAIEVMRKVWSGEPVSHRGRFYEFPELTVRPAPPSPVPIYIGGGSDAAIERAARIGDGFIPPVGAQEETARYRRALADLRRRHGREEEPFTLLASAVDGRAPAELETIEASGVDTVRVDPFALYEKSYGNLDWQRRRAALERYAREVLRPLRGA